MEGELEPKMRLEGLVDGQVNISVHPLLISRDKRGKIN